MPPANSRKLMLALPSSPTPSSPSATLQPGGRQSNTGDSKAPPTIIAMTWNVFSDVA